MNRVVVALLSAVVATSAWSVPFASPAAAATRVLIQSGAAGSEAAETTEVWAERDRMRVDLAGGRRSVIYVVKEGLVWALDHEKRTFTELDRSTAVGMAGRVRGIETELRARTADLPADARAAAEGLLDATFGAPVAGAPELELRATGGHGRVRGVPCQEVDVLENGTRTARFCEATLAAAGLGVDALVPLRSLAEFARELAPLMPARVRDGGVAALDLFDRVAGVPLHVLTYREGKPDREATVTDVSEAAPPDAAFAVPEGYSPDVAIKVRERLGGP